MTLYNDNYIGGGKEVDEDLINGGIKGDGVGINGGLDLPSECTFQY